MKRYVPDPTEMVKALAARVDVLERRTQTIDTDLTAVGRGVAHLTAQLRNSSRPGSTSSTASTTSTATTRPTGGNGGGENGEDDEGQRDWLAVTDPDTAAEWLTDAEEFAGTVLARHGLCLADAPCWPLHPDTVTELLALIAQRDDAYHGVKPSAVSEWLTRWLPAACDRIRGQLGACLADRCHVAEGRFYDATAVTAGHAALWWTTARHAPAHSALRLPCLD